MGVIGGKQEASTAISEISAGHCAWGSPHSHLPTYHTTANLGDGRNSHTERAVPTGVSYEATYQRTLTPVPWSKVFIIFGPQIWGDIGGYSGIHRDTAGYTGISEIQRDAAGCSGIL